MKVLIADPIAYNGIDLLRKEGVDADEKTGLKREELLDVIGDYDGLVVRSKTKVTAEIIEAGKKLKVILRAGSGIDNVDVEEATKKNIVVMNVPGGNTVSAAEHAIAMLFALARNIPQADASMKDGKWEKKKFSGVEINEKVLGIVGLGKIGREVALRARALGMDVIAFDPIVPAEEMKKMGIRPVALEELIKTSDYITIHSPLNKDTKHVISEKEFSMMKPTARLVNCARGGIIDENALYHALRDGKIAGAALDVYESEPPEHGPLMKLENIILTPHLGASTREAQIRVAVEGAGQIVDLLKKSVARNAINVPPVKLT